MNNIAFYLGNIRFYYRTWFWNYFYPEPRKFNLKPNMQWHNYPGRRLFGHFPMMGPTRGDTLYAPLESGHTGLWRFAKITHEGEEHMYANVIFIGQL